MLKEEAYPGLYEGSPIGNHMYPYKEWREFRD